MINYTKTDFDITKLGSFYSQQKTIFRVFAPESKGVSLHIANQSFNMHRKNYYYEIAIGGNLEGYRYYYKHSDGTEFRDPFAYYSDDKYSYILNPRRFNDTKIEVKNKKKTVIYETSVRDFSCDDSFPNDVKRKFLSLTFENLKINNYYMAGLDYLKNLGISHIQILPVFSFDLDRADYNWGYNPLAYNLIHSDYVLQKDNAYAHVNELRKMVNCFHGNDIRVILDVVFNHVYRAGSFDLAKMVGMKHVFRYKSDGKMANGTYCGNEIKSEDLFMREYIVYMCKRYVELFDIDGIRMDLMGILDYETVNRIKDELREIKPEFMVYGEGWNMGDVLYPEKRASLNNASKMKDIGMFNDFFRETMINAVVKGDVNLEKIEAALSGNSNNLNPETSINYVECHDNSTFYDRLIADNNDISIVTAVQKCKLALGLVLLSKGIPFIHAGEEFLRTKKMVENSYNSDESINKIDWNRRVEYNDVCDFTKSLIKIRNEYDFDGDISFEDHNPILVCHIGKLDIYFNLSELSGEYNLNYTSRLIFDGTNETDEIRDILDFPPYSLMICTH
ncbi:MAG: alpha-amylase family glycosyl hydrolase [Erysipelotrichaceae bacterium]|nr:alpha-amylase family glycosyl hydrolase [Erysipelotrichaceae bacterium]